MEKTKCVICGKQITGTIRGRWQTADAAATTVTARSSQHALSVFCSKKPDRLHQLSKQPQTIRRRKQHNDRNEMQGI